MKKDDFKPYIPAESITPELTVTSVVMGIVLAVVFGAANAYLGLRVGMTVSASIPAAVVSMAVIRVILKRDSVLECNIVQTIGSAGESLAAGAIFTLPVLFLWSAEGLTDKPDILTITVIAGCGGVLGILFMVPLRNALIVKEHGTLPYPEGTACAEVLLAGEEGKSSAKPVFAGMGFAALFKIITDGLKIVPGVITIPVNRLKTELSAEVYPALIGVGYICGPKIASYMLAGGMLGWFVIIPAIVIFGKDTVLYPGVTGINDIYVNGGATAIWSNYVRYIGAGAVAAGGIISLIKTLPLILRTFRDSLKGLGKRKDKNIKRTDINFDMRFVICGIMAIVLGIWLVPFIPVSLTGAVLIVVFGFFFATVSSRMVGLVGSSNNPVSGMAIATLLITTLVIKGTGDRGISGMTGAIAIGSVICIIAAMAGDTSQDLKTGYILGATPKKQQIGELIGAVVSALTIGGVLMLLDSAWKFGSTELMAPQATLMKIITEGVMEGNLPWELIFIGVFIALTVEVMGISVLPVAIGLYLPLELSGAIMTGGIIRWIADKRKKVLGAAESESDDGILFCSGMIAGEGVVGISLALMAVFNVSDKLNLSSYLNTGFAGGIVLILCMAMLILKYSFKSIKKKAG